MPFDGYTQKQYAQNLVNKFHVHGIKSSRVFLQSFLETDILFWIDHKPDFGKQAVYLDERVDTSEGDANATATMDLLAKRGVKIISPPFFALTMVNDKGKMVPSEYAVAARRAGLDIVAWSFDRYGWLQIDGGGYYYSYVKNVTKHDGDMYEVLDVLTQQV